MARKPAPQTPLEALWRPSAILWALCAGEGLAVVLSLAPGDAWTADGSLLRRGVVASLTVQWVLLFSLGGLYLCRRALENMRPQRLAYVALAALLVSSWFVTGGIVLFFSDSVAPPPEGWTMARWRAIGAIMTAGVAGVAVFQSYWRTQQMALRLKEAELQALQARIRPHFLFNTLNTGAALVHAHPGEAETLLLDLADLFRAALAGPRDVLLSEELGLARRYLEIEKLRFGDRLRVEWQLPNEIPRVSVPSLSIQPLIENAIRHGVERVPQGGRIDIAVTSTASFVVVQISNPLVFVDGKPPPGHGVGLQATQARIEALTGGQGTVKTEVRGELYVATVRLPRPRPANRA